MHTLFRRHRGLILLAGIVAAGAASFTAAASASPSTPASTTLIPAAHSSPARRFVNASIVTPPACAPQAPNCNPTNYTPPVYEVAVGFGATETAAQKDAEQEADQVCGLRGWTRVKGLPIELANQFKYTLTYACD